MRLRFPHDQKTRCQTRLSPLAFLGTADLEKVTFKGSKMLEPLPLPENVNRESKFQDTLPKISTRRLKLTSRELAHMIREGKLPLRK